MRFLPVSLTVLVLISGCGLFWGDDPPAITTVEARLGEPFTLREGQTAVLAETGGRLRYVETLSDSRCPLNVECFWAGEAHIALEWTVGRRMPASFRMVGYFGPDGDGDTTLDTLNYRFSWLNLTPYPVFDPDTEEVHQGRPLEATFIVAPASEAPPATDDG